MSLLCKLGVNLKPNKIGFDLKRIMQIHNQTDKERQKYYYRYLEIGLHDVLLNICGAYKLNRQVPQSERLVNLLPVKMIYGFYAARAFVWDNPITGEAHKETFEKSEKGRLQAIRNLNELIAKHNEDVEKYNAVTPFEKRDHKKYRTDFLFWEWGLNAQLSKPTLPVIDRPEWQIGDEVFGLVHWDNEYLYKKALRISRQEEYVPFLNKMIYEYLRLMTSVENREEHIFHKPMLEFENWFMMKGLSIEHTPNMIDIGDGKILSNPLAQKLEETEKKYQESQYEQINLINIWKKQGKANQKRLEKVTRMKPKESFKQMVDSGEMDTFLKKKGNTFKKSGKVNMSAVAEEIGVSEGKIAKKYFEEYAPRFLKADTEGYTFDDTGDNTIYKVTFKNHSDMYVKKHEIDTIDKRWKVKSIEHIKQAKP